MSDETGFSTAEVAERLGVSREMVNQYAAALEAQTGESLKVKGGARRFPAASVAVLERLRRLLLRTSNLGLEEACRQALEGQGPNDDPARQPGELPAALLAEFREEREALTGLRLELAALLKDLGELAAGRDRLEAVVDDCATEVQELGATVRGWPVRFSQLEGAVRSALELERGVQRQIEELRHYQADLERGAFRLWVKVWAVGGLGAYLLGFHVLPWLRGVLGW